MRAILQGMPFVSLVEIKPIKGKFSLDITEGSSIHSFNTSRVFGPEIAATAHCSDTLVTFTFKSVQRIWSNSSNHDITLPA